MAWQFLPTMPLDLLLFPFLREPQGIRVSAVVQSVDCGKLWAFAGSSFVVVVLLLRVYIQKT